MGGRIIFYIYFASNRWKYVVAAISANHVNWFSSLVIRRVGNGAANTLFLSDRWLGSVPLCESFPHLFLLSEKKVRSVGRWENGSMKIGVGFFDGGVGF
jgi:hypothetical protein